MWKRHKNMFVLFNPLHDRIWLVIAIVIFETISCNVWLIRYTKLIYSTYLSLASFAAGDSGTTNKTWIGSVILWAFVPDAPSVDPPTIENPQLAFSLLWRITVFGYCRFLGSFCQYIQLGIKLDAPNEVSGPSITPNITWSLFIVAFKVVTAWEWVRPHKPVSSTDRSKSPFYKYKKLLRNVYIQRICQYKKH